MASNREDLSYPNHLEDPDPPPIVSPRKDIITHNKKTKGIIGNQSRCLQPYQTKGRSSVGSFYHLFTSANDPWLYKAYENVMV